MKPDKQLTQGLWIKANTAGWFIGIILVIGLALLGEAVMKSSEQSGGQAVVGMGMGAGVGFMQWLVLRRYWESVQKWLWFSIIGFTISFVLFDLIAANAKWKITAEVALPFATVLGALICSWLQYTFVLQKIASKTAYWLLYNTIAWVLAELITSGVSLLKLNLSAFFPKVIIVVLALLFLSVGGPILGYITGKFIVPLVNEQSPNKQ